MVSALPYTVVAGDSRQIPEFALHKPHADDAGFDLRASERCQLEPGDSVTVPTGIRIALAPGYCALMLPRSGLASRYGLTIPNAPGLIDAGFRGEIKVPLYLQPSREDIWHIAHGVGEPRSYHIAEGDRIAQLIIVQLGAIRANFFSPERFQTMWGETERGERGFGSSGR